MPRWVWWTVSWFGVSGCFRRARGTWGSLATLPFAWLIHALLGPSWLATAGALLFLLGVIASNRYVALTGKEDPGEIVIDEVAALCLLLACMPLTTASYLTGFLMFRAFDVLKPWPVSLADRHIQGGFGVMFDDLLAAGYPLLLFYLLSLWQPDFANEIQQWLLWF